MAAYMLAKHTGARHEQIWELSVEDHLEGGIIRVPALKKDNPSFLPEHPEITAYLDTLPQGRFVPHLLSSVGSALCDNLNAIGLLRDLALHGLRRTTGKRLAEAGMTSKETQAVFVA